MYHLRFRLLFLSLVQLSDSPVAQDLNTYNLVSMNPMVLQEISAGMGQYWPL